MDSDEQALLNRICLHPADDAPRLIFADWCDEHNAADRATFIRKQIELYHLLKDTPRRHWLNLDLISDPQDHERQAWKHRVWRLQKECGDLFRWGDVRGDAPLTATEMTGWHKIDTQHFGWAVERAGPTSPTGAFVYYFLWERGFIAEVTAGYEHLHHGAARFVRQAPITRMFASDRRPYQDGPHLYRWTWVGDDVNIRSYTTAQRDHVIRRSIYDLLPVNYHSHDRPHNRFESAEEAERYLSWALVTWGRDQNDLPRLETP